MTSTTIMTTAARSPATGAGRRLPALLLSALLAGISGTASADPAWPLNDTGLDWWASASESFLGAEPPDFPAQDASLGRDAALDDDSDGQAGFVFTKLDATGAALPPDAAEWSCVRDEVTGLVWEAKTDDDGLHDRDDRYTWHLTDSQRNGGNPGVADAPGARECSGYADGQPGTYCNTLAFTDRVNTEGLCGRRDWRLPTVEELQSVVDYSRRNSALDPQFFPDVNPDDAFLWSGASFARDASSAWAMVVDYGYSELSQKAAAHPARLVRGGRSLAEGYRLSLALSGDGHGRVVSDPEGIDCGTQCEASFPRGTRVTLTATPGLGFRPDWGGACSGTQPTCEVTLSADTAVALSFNDSAAPIVTPPADIRTEATALQTPVAIGQATTDDGSPATSDAPAAFPLGTTTVTWSATDSAGNTGTATQRVTVADTTPPVLAMPPNLTVESTGALTPVELGNATATDLFGPVTVSNNAPAGGFPLGTTPVTWIATDANGNSAVGFQTVTVTDGTAPVVTPPADVTAEATAELTPVALGTATSDDGSPVTNDAPAAFPLGTTTVTWSATDSAGNRGTSTQRVTIVDTTAPVLTPPADVVVDATGLLTAVTLGEASADDIFAVTVSNDAPAAGFPVGETLVIWSATDAKGNRATATQRVRVNDADIRVLSGDILVSDFQTDTLIRIDPESGEQTLLLPAGTLDVMGVVPSLDGVVYLSSFAGVHHLDLASGALSLIASGGQLRYPIDMVAMADGRLLVVDRDSRAVFALDPETGIQTPIASNGLINRPHSIALEPDGGILVANDASGGASLIRIDPMTGAQTTLSSGGQFSNPIGVAVSDRGEILVADGNALDSGAIFEIDANTGAQRLISTGGEFNDPQELAIDAEGNLLVLDFSADAVIRVDLATGAQTLVSSGGALVSSIDIALMPMLAITPPADITAEATGVLTPIELGEATAGTGSILSNDAPAAGFPLGETLVTWTAADAAGNTGIATQRVTIVDTTAPVLTVPGDISTVATGPLTGVVIGDATATDLFGPVTIGNDAPAGGFPVGTTQVTWTATDANGNRATGIQNVVLNDGAAPVVTPPDDVTAEATAELTPVALGTATSDDGSPVTSDAPAAFPLGTTTVTWSATDSAGNTGTATQRVTIVDTTAPALTVPGDVTVESTGELTPVELGNAAATDLFGPVTVGNDAPAGGFPIGVTPVTWTATDANGNRASRTQQVTVTDPGVPVDGPNLRHGVIESVGDAWQTVHLPTPYADPVVIATVQSDRTRLPVVTRVRNAQGDSFELRVQSPGDAPVQGTYRVHYLVVEAGVYTQAENGIKLEALKVPSSRTDGRVAGWRGQAAAYRNVYGSPVVLGQVMTANDLGWSAFWARGADRTTAPTRTRLFIGKHVGEDPDAVRIEETLGYLVIEAGQSQIGGLAISAGVTAANIQGMDNRPPYWIVHGLTAPTGALASSAAMRGGEGGWPVLYGSVPLADGQLDLAIDEDKVLDAERAHVGEPVSYLVLGQAGAENGPHLRSGLVEDVGDAWQTVTLPRVYADPVVLATVQSDQTLPPAVARVRQAAGGQFALRVQNPSGEPLAGGYQVHYLVAEAGVYSQPEHGIKLEAVKLASSRTDGRVSGWRGQSVRYANAYSNPVVLGQVMSANDTRWSVFWSRGASRDAAANAASLFVGKHVGEDPTTARATETLGYLVMEKGEVTLAGQRLRAGLSPVSIRGAGNQPPYRVIGLPSDAEHALVSAAGMREIDGGWPILYGFGTPSAGRLDLAIEEDQLRDVETGHAAEAVSYLVVTPGEE